MALSKVGSNQIDSAASLTVSGNVSVDGGTIKLDGNYPTGSANVALGNVALDDGSLSGGHNTAIGNNAASANTSGAGKHHRWFVCLCYKYNWWAECGNRTFCAER